MSESLKRVSQTLSTNVCLNDMSETVYRKKLSQMQISFFSSL